MHSPSGDDRHFTQQSQETTGLQTVSIGTHGGIFHCDEALACFMLIQLSEYKDARIIRTRVQTVLDSCDAVVDVGGRYDHEHKKYDHHQRGFNKTMNSLDPAYPWTTPLSSAGLVYFHYGHRILAGIMGRDESDDFVKRIYAKVYEEFVQAIDAADNGKSPNKKHSVAKYRMNSSLSARVSYSNVTNILHSRDQITEEKQQECFDNAMELAGYEFVAKIKYLTDVWWPAKKLADDANEKHVEVFPSSKLVHLLQGAPWVDRIFTVDEVRETEVTRKLYIITKEIGDERWQVQLVSTKEEPYLVQSPVGEQTLKTIGTHDGPFHCDEALACFILKQLPEYKDALVIRTNDPVMLDRCDVVVDVGGKYDPARDRYDHHQSGFNKMMKSLDSAYPWETKLSSAGLVYYHYGHRVLAEIMGSEEADEEMINRIYSKFYSDFVEAVDAIDNGILPTKGGHLFLINTCLGDRISNLNHYWNDTYDARNLDVQFLEAMKLIGLEVTDCVNAFKTLWWPARKIVATAIKNRYKTDRSGKVLHVKPGCSWMEHLFELEAEESPGNMIKFVVFYDELSKKYTVQGVPKYFKSKTVRLLLPHRWRGLSAVDLRRKSGVHKSEFVHREGYIGYGRTLESVLQMARKALQVTTSAEQ